MSRLLSCKKLSMNTISANILKAYQPFLQKNNSIEVCLNFANDVADQIHVLPKCLLTELKKRLRQDIEIYLLLVMRVPFVDLQKYPLSYETCYQAMKQNGLNLNHLKRKTFTLCYVAICENSVAFKFLKVWFMRAILKIYTLTH